MADTAAPTAAQKNYARKKTRLAVQTGKLERPGECSKCGAEEVQAHHHDYAKPLEVEWLCGDCHRSAHAGEQKGRPGGPGRRPKPARSEQEMAELRGVEDGYERAFRRSEELREERNAAVRAAAAAGWTHAQIAEAMGLTRARVAQLAPQPRES